MKVSRFLRDKKTYERVADLRPKILIAFIINMVAVVAFWVFRLACVKKVGFWYTIWSALYHFSRFTAVVLLITLGALFIYMLVFSIRDKFSPNGSFKPFFAKPSSQKKAEPGDYNWHIETGDLSEFD